MSKFEIAISTLFIGFFLGQATDFLKHRWQISRKKKALRAEILDVKNDFIDKEFRLENIILNMSDLHIGVAVPGNISSLIFDKYYSDIAPYLSSVERKSILLVYDHVFHYNQERDKGDRHSFEHAKKSLFLMHSQCLFGNASAGFFLETGGQKLFSLEENRIIAINEKIDKFAREAGITT